MAYGKMNKMDKKMPSKSASKNEKPMSAKTKSLAAKAEPKNKVTKADIITATQMKESGMMKAKKK